MAKKEISWILRAKDSVSTVLNRVGKKFKSFASGGMKFAKLLSGAFLAIGAGAVAMGAKFIASYQKQAQAEAKLTAVLKATGYAAGFTTEQLKAQAAEIQKNTGIGDELTLSMQGILASFKNIKGDQFSAATMAILDMSTVMTKAGKDTDQIEQASIQLGKALNDPIKGISALSRVGIMFTDQQKEQIRTLQESGDMMSAQKIILEELKSEFGGAAEGVDKNVKSFRLFKDAIGDTEEEIGRALTENMTLTSVFDKLTKVLNNLVESGAIDLWIERLVSGLNEAKPLLELTMYTLGGLYKAFKFVQDGAKMAAQAGVNYANGMNFSDAVKTAAQDVALERQTSELRLKNIRKEREVRKKARAEEEKEEMKTAQVKQKIKDELTGKAKTENEISAITKDLEHRARIQELLNKGKKTEVELMKIEKKLGRELTESEKGKITERLEALKKAEEGKTASTDLGQPKTQTAGIALEKIGAIFSSPLETKTDILQLKSIAGLTKKQNGLLQKLIDKDNDNSLGAV